MRPTIARRFLVECRIPQAGNTQKNPLMAKISLWVLRNGPREVPLFLMKKVGVPQRLFAISTTILVTFSKCLCVRAAHGKQ
jgi:hypothetical protein